MIQNFGKNIKKLFWNKYLVNKNIDIIYFTFLLIWLFEWFYFFEYCLNFWSSTRLIFPYRLPILLLICFLYWVYIWGISVWRRTQYGRFTRGDRKLWTKSFAAFWIIEIFTVGGIYLCICWLSWGPIIFMPRYFWVPKKGFLVELTFFTYILWLAYLIRFSLKWQLWKTQFYITLLIILIIFCLIWRDISTLYFRELVNINSGSNWRYIKLTSLIYSLSSDWWLEHYIGHWKRNIYTHYVPLNRVLKNISENNFTHPFNSIEGLTDYEQHNWLPYQFKSFWVDNLGFSFKNKWKYNPMHLYFIQDKINILNSEKKLILLNEISHGGIFYPRRIGTLPKRLGMWYMLIVIKIWHHFMLFIWWFFYLIRLYTRKKSSYSLLSICYFNIYCCFLIGLLVYLYHVLPFLELYLKYRPMIQSWKHYQQLFYNSITYCINIFFGEELYWTSKSLKYKFNISFIKFINFKIYFKFMLDPNSYGLNCLDLNLSSNSLFSTFPSNRTISLLDTEPNPLLCEKFICDYSNLFDAEHQSNFKEEYMSYVNLFK